MGKRKRRATFGAIRKLPSGRYQASHLDNDKRRIVAPTTFTRKEDADAWLGMQRIALENGTWRAPRSNQTLRDYSDQWMKERKVRPSTLYANRLTLNNWILPTLGDTRLTDLTSAKVRAWLNTIPPDKKSVPLSAYRLLSSILNSAATDGHIPANPVKVRKAVAYRPAREGRVLTPSEVDAIASNMPARQRLSVPISAYCALRIGEVLALRRNDIDLTARTITIRASAGESHTAGRLGPPKTSAGRRTVHYPPNLADQIAKHLDLYTGKQRSALLFPSPITPELPTTPNTLRKYFHQAAEAAEIEDVRPHDLRHTGLTWAAATGATVAELMHRAGHSSPGVAIKYQHASRERDRSIADALGQIEDKRSTE